MFFSGLLAGLGSYLWLAVRIEQLPALVIAVIAVVASLLYLGLQVKQNTDQAKAAARYQFVEATGQLNAVIAGDKSAASVFRRGLEDIDTLDADERFQFLVFVGHFFQIYSVMFELHEDDLLPASQWHNVKKDILSIVGTEGGRKIWAGFGNIGLDPKFSGFVNRLIADGEETYDLTKI